MTGGTGLFYFRKIVSYLDYYEYGEKRKNCGYGKILVKDEEVTVEIHVKGLGIHESRMCDIFVSSEEKLRLGRFIVDKGTGYYNACFQRDDMDGAGLCVFDITGLFIRIDENKYCETEWEWGEVPDGYRRRESAGRPAEIVKMPEPSAALSESSAASPEQAHSEETTEETAPRQKTEAPRETEDAKESPASDHTPPERMRIWIPEASLIVQPERSGEAGQPQEGESAGQQDTYEAGENGAGGTETEKAERAATEKEKAGEKQSGTRFQQTKPEAAIPQSAVMGDPETDFAAEPPAFIAEYSVPAEPPYAGQETDDADGALHKSQITKAGALRQAERLEDIPLQKMLHEDKWTQLCTLYPVCHPFGDDEDYITIAPKDFIILRKEYQNLVSNSFLLHSFYNYHHVILGKTGGKKDEIYYIGVPGAYFERDKRVAVMFGFEGFALSARGNGERGTPEKKSGVETGAFGYYMRKVEI